MKKTFKGLKIVYYNYLNYYYSTIGNKLEMVNTKIKKSKGWYRLVVDDSKINKAYDCSQKEPIVLATISNFFDSGCWSVEDFRLTQHKTPSNYLEGSYQNKKEFKNEQEKNKITSRLHTYIEEHINDKNYIIWDSFELAAFDGDNPSCKDKRGYQCNVIARFSYKMALAELIKIQSYWNNFNGVNLEEGRIENKYRQISKTALMIEDLIEEEKLLSI